jgi:hypothetical protein
MNKNLYFNARITTEGAAKESNPKFKASYSIDIPQGLIRDPSKSLFSVIRFTTTLHGLPALFVKHPVDGATTGETSYRFAMRYKNTVVYRSASWFPADKSALPTTGKYGDDYWSEYNYFRMCRFLNDALDKLTTELVAACQGLETAPPYFHYDSAAATFSFNWPPTMLEGSEPVELFYNEEAHHLMSGFPVSPCTDVPGMDGKFLLFRQSPADLPTSIGGVDYYSRNQLPGSLSTWCPIRRLVLTTQSLGLVSEIVSQVTASTSGQGVPSSTTTSQKVFADFTPNLVRGDEMITGTCEYQPTAQYRFVNFNNNDAVMKFDFDICWEDHLGKLHVAPLTYGGYASLKADLLTREP